MSFTYRIPLSDLKAGYTDNETCIYLAGIARLNNGKYRYGKFAIAQDNNRNGKYFWKSWLHKYCIAECIESVNSDCGTFDCATAWMEGTEYFYGETETGFYTSLPSELNNKYAILAVLDPVCGKRIEVGKVEIMFWGASSQYDLFIEFQPYDGYDIQDARIYAGILEPLREPDTFKNHITFADQNTLVFKMKTDYEPVYISITATVCTENNSLSVLNRDD
jgi:hypothetical protein